MKSCKQCLNLSFEETTKHKQQCTSEAYLGKSASNWIAERVYYSGA
jgi:hypothetical protein